MTADDIEQVAIRLIQILKPTLYAQIEERVRAFLSSRTAEIAEGALQRKIERLIEVDVRVNRPRQKKRPTRKR